ncbi:MAG: hypothetical protein AAGF93_02155 [Cyanobacteria bacterium P01_H01_bin.105]
MVENSGFRSIYTEGGDYREVHNKGTYVEGSYYNSFEARQNLVVVAREIQAMLVRLEENYSPTTSTGKIQIAAETIKQIEADPNWQSRLISALQAGGTSALSSLLDHPAANFVIAAIEDWRANKKGY